MKSGESSLRARAGADSGRADSARAAGITATALLALLVCGCMTDHARLPDLPARLAGLPLVTSMAGDSARREIGMMHGKGVAPRESRIGLYALGGFRAAVYASRYASSGEAERQLRAMADRMGPGSGGFGHHMRLDVAGIEVHSVIGFGDQHYFYARGAVVYWLTVPAELAHRALAQMLDVSPDAIPRDVPLSRPRSGGPAAGS